MYRERLKSNNHNYNMDYSKEFDDLQTYLKNDELARAKTLLDQNTNFTKYHADGIIHLLSKELTETNYIEKRKLFNFCEVHLHSMAENIDLQENVFDFIELIDLRDCKLSSTVSIAITVLNTMENPNLVCLEYLLSSTFNHLNEMDSIRLENNLLHVISMLTKLEKHINNQLSALFYFVKMSYLFLRTNIDPITFLDTTRNLLSDPFYLLEYEFEQTEERILENKCMASFFYLYLKNGILWNPKVYSRFYILEKLSNLAMSVFEDDRFGKSFTKLILTKYKENEIPLHSLNKHHEEFFMEAAHTSLYNLTLDVRKDSFESLMLFIDKLCSEAQYIVFRRVFTKLIDSGLKAELVIKMKQLLFSKIKNQEDSQYFKGKRLLEMVQLCCNIPYGPECDVINNKEHVLAAITLAYVLYGYNGDGLCMDKPFLNYLDVFVSVVQNAIDYSAVQYKLESIKLNNPGNCKEDTISVQVQNENLPIPSLNEKRKMLSQYNTTIKLIQSNLDLLKGIIKCRN
ncbi:uncharacterized protein LOC126838650 isoform X2 [Adelges cooleyi]|nr:uncharacterized protein LOC126838650 isoform X2 [Adelges cooleyi]